MYRLFYIDLVGAEAVKIKLTRGARRVMDMRPGLRQVADDLRRIIRIQFESQGRRGGGSWKFLDSDTVKRKAARNLDPRIMFARQRLFDSLTKPGSRNAEVRIDGRQLIFRSRLPYADVQHAGGGPSKLPARPLFNILPSDESNWVDMVEREIESSMRGGRLR